ncbi:MAG TPA: EamA family transporter [Leptolyngbyaceae cyanobacterium M65_K2018_010]|nr:EamA family transporter [Leptolyngbyaceae cyanobacterium M65_K2018_010]
MGPIDHLPNDPNPQSEPRRPEEVLQALSQDLDLLRAKLSTQLGSEIAALERRKQDLMVDIEALEQDFTELQTQYQQLQAIHTQTLTEQQQAQQQVWAKRLAQALATHLQARLEAALLPPTQTGSVNALATFTETSQRLAALDTTLHQTLQSLQQDLNSYQSSLSQQVSRMQSMEQQGEAILEALVTRLSYHLQQQMVQPSMAARDATNGHRSLALPTLANPEAYPAGGQAGSITPAMGPAALMAPQPATPFRSTLSTHPSGFRPAGPGRAAAPRGQWSEAPPPARGSRSLPLGLWLVMLATLALALHYVLVGLMGYGGEVLGRWAVPGVFPLTFPNTLMLLWLRMVVVVPLLAVVAVRLRPPLGEDLTQLWNSQDKRPLMQVLASGSFLFLAQVLIYMAIAEVGPGVAIALLFMYPLLTVPLAWFLWGDRPTPLRLVVMFAITMGVVFTALPRLYSEASGWGIGAAIVASTAFALHLTAKHLSIRRLSSRRLHPVSLSLMQFATVLGLTSGFLIVASLFGLSPSQPSSQLGLYLGGLGLGLFTLLSSLFHHSGASHLGSARADIVTASGPVVTAVLAYLLIPGEQSALQFIQWMGVVLVTLGVISLSLERLANLKRTAPGAE